ncbi:hypothetical protein SAMN04488074_105247 [Lentzea albidocapillata subsp. violacea]|uniref:Uncharacterized protein n=1 Tax=Lentzea albidocapillata subsp. violacea TaxID=128104 RepID=A0A1G9B8Q1_9PSEU|nr:hypothetical protein [Lentzea albidocapillata]SDK35400.1 hypothetical protein SAMN04488074_105247 [Lentzea albidocapillata subsp. violacea]
MQTFTPKRSAFFARTGAITAVVLLALSGTVTAAHATCTPLGTWTGYVTRTDGDHPTKLQFKANGKVFVTNEQNTTTQGSWWPTGVNKFHYQFRGEKVYDENGAYFAYVDFDQDAVQSGPDNFTSSGPSTFFLADGTNLGTSTITFTMARG